jgi:hypothetical protein
VGAGGRDVRPDLSDHSTSNQALDMAKGVEEKDRLAQKVEMEGCFAKERWRGSSLNEEDISISSPAGGRGGPWRGPGEGVEGGIRCSHCHWLAARESCT